MADETDNELKQDFGESDVAEAVFGESSVFPSAPAKAPEETTSTKEGQPSTEDQAALDKAKLDERQKQDIENQRVEDETLLALKAKKEKEDAETIKDKSKSGDNKVEDKTKSGQQQIDSNKDKSRDYAGLDEKQIAFLKKQPNSVYDFVAPILKSSQTAKAEVVKLQQELEKSKDPNRIPENYYDNEQALQLTPEYQQLSARYSRVETEAEFMQKQLINVQQNLPYQVLGYSKERGYFVAETKPVPEDVNAKATLLNELETRKNWLMNEKASLIQKESKLQEDFKSTAVKVKEHYKPLLKQHLDALPPELKPAKEELDQFYSIVHPAHKDSSITEVAANLFSLALRQGRVINGLIVEADKGKKLIEDRTLAGPTNRSSQTGGANIRKELGPNGQVKKDAKEIFKNGVIDFNELGKDIEGE